MSTSKNMTLPIDSADPGWAYRCSEGWWARWDWWENRKPKSTYLYFFCFSGPSSQLCCVSSNGRDSITQFRSRLRSSSVAESATLILNGPLHGSRPFMLISVDLQATDITSWADQIIGEDKRSSQILSFARSHRRLLERRSEEFPRSRRQPLERRLEEFDYYLPGWSSPESR